MGRDAEREAMLTKQRTAGADAGTRQSGHRRARLVSAASTLLYWSPPIAWMVFIFVMSSRSQVPNPCERPFFRQLLQGAAHLLLYGVLLALLWRAMQRTWPDRRTIPWALLIGFLFAVSDEYHQSFVPERHCTLADVVIDAAGMLLAWRLMQILYTPPARALDAAPPPSGRDAAEP
jgi:VanZ family protein